MKKIAILVLIFLIVSLYSSGKISVVTSIPPLGYAVQMLGGELIDTNVLMRAGDNPHIYTPMPRKILEISRASGFVTLGLGIDDWIVEKVRSVNPSIPVLVASDGLAHLAIGKPGAYNPHIWLDVKLYEMICVKTCAFLIELAPEDKDIFRRNLGILLVRLDSLDSRIRSELLPIRGRDFVVQHPAWDYFARAYGLGKEYSLATGSEQNVGPREYSKILNVIKKEHIKAIIGDLVTPSRLTESAAKESNSKIVKLNPISIFNYFDLMKGITKGFLNALK
ncbi:MAG: zinc ABC transporter substrate-binding protein [Thermotogae bacterium]|nr:zinc ABC transporter substrate-binding protein [Thermotogota bacterium]